MIKAGGKTFKTKTTLTNYCKYVLNNAELNSILEGEWFEVVNDVLRMHECYSEKTKGLDYKIGVRTCFINPRNRQFFILRSDGSDTDFSFYKAMSSTSKQTRIKQILRESIKEQTIDYKDKYFLLHQDSQGYVVCPETNLKIKKKDSHIDHYPLQFDEIIKEWSFQFEIDSESIELLAPGDNATVWKFKDENILDSFVQFHEYVAAYRVVLNKVNLQRKRAKRAQF